MTYQIESFVVPAHVCEGQVEIRRAGNSDAPLFCLADVCKALEIGDVRDVARRLDEDDRVQNPATDALGREQQTWFVNESGLYTVLVRSDKPKAQPFRRWVTKEVLPSIRRYGTYPPPAEAQDHILGEIATIQHALTVAAETRKAQLALEHRQDQLERAIDRVEAVASAARDKAESNYGMYTILAWLRLQRRDCPLKEAAALGRQAASLCRGLGVPVGSVNDPRFGSVNTYPEGVLTELLGPRDGTLH